MVIRIETTNITRGREFSLYAYADEVPIVSLYAYNSVLDSYEVLNYVHSQAGVFHRFDAVAPSIDGFLLAKINSQKLIKRIGIPINTFVLGYKDNYTLPYKALDLNGNPILSGNLTNIIDGFYATPITQSVVMVETIGKRFMINKNIEKMNYEITMEGGELNSTFDNMEMENMTLPNMTLSEVILGDATLASTLPTVTIEEF